MISIKKFYNAEDEGGGAAAVETATPSVVELMAKQGVFNSTENKVAKPIEIKATEEVKATDQSTPAVTAIEEKKVDEQKPVPATEEPKAQVQEQKADAPKAEVPKWQEVLKQQPKDQVLKEIGLDDKMIAFLNHWESNNGDVKDYLKELSTDYSKMPSEEVMRHQLRNDYPKATEAQIEALYKKEVVNAYNLDSDDDDEVAEGRLLLDAKADKYRDAFSDKQKDYLFPKPQEKPDTAVQEAAEQQQRLDAYKKQVTESPFVKDVINNKQLVIGEGEEGFKFKVDNPDNLTDLLFDTEKWTQKFFNIEKGADGKDVFTPDTELQMIVAAIVNDRKGFFKDIAQHYKSLGGKTVIEPIENAKPKEVQQPQRSQSTDTSPAALMAKQGRVTSGGVNN